MKICLINPPQILYQRLGRPFVFQPLGLLYVAAVLEKDYPVEIVDATLEGWRELREIDGKYYLGLPFEKLKQRIENIKPDIVGISVPFSVNEFSALKVASIVKEIDKNIITILGGHHPSVRPIETLSFENVDFVVIGEGEISVPELIRKLKLQDYNELKNIAGIGYKENGSPVLTSPRKLIQDLDALPFPARHLVPMEEYFNAMKTKKGSRPSYTFNDRWTSIITSRGCVYNCNFCSIHLTMGRKFRARSPENIIREIKQVIKDYDIKHINFEDDNLTFNKKRAEHIFQMMIEDKLNITWSTPNGIRVESIDEEMVKKMKDSGCKRIFVAPESGVQRVVNQIIGKNLDLKKIENAVSLFKKHGIIIDGSFVIGFIGETKKEIWSTIKYALKLKKMGMAVAGIHIATPYYGTRLYEEAKQKGFLRKDLDDSLFSTSEPLISTPEWTLNEIHGLHKKAQWLVNYSVKEKILDVLWNYFHVIYKCLRYIKRTVLWCLKLPYRIYNFVSFWGTLAKKDIKNLILEISNKFPEVEYLVYEVTDACNSRCQHCNIWKNKATEELLTAEDIAKIFADNFFNNLKYVLLTGGEPVLHKEIKEIIMAIHRVRPKVKMTLSTNALLSKQVLEVIKYTLANNISISVGVSLDAMGEKHDWIRGVKGNFEKADYLLKELIKLREKYGYEMLGIVIGHTLSNLTVDTLKDVAQYAQQMNVSFSTQLHEEFAFYNNTNENRNDKVRDYLYSANCKLIEEIENLPASFHNETLLSALKHKLKYRCSSMKNFFLLRCDGSVTPCLRFSDVNAGNIKSHTPGEIWQSASAQKLRKLVEDCKGCSNSWATGWSFEYWFFSFWKIIINLYVKTKLSAEDQ